MTCLNPRFLLAFGLLTVLLSLALTPSAHAVSPKPQPKVLHSDPEMASDPVAVSAARERMVGVSGRSLRAAQAAPGLPTQWCGDPTAGNNADAPGAQTKLVYAFAADQPNRFGAWANALQGNVATIGRFLANASGNRKTLRFDMGTRCGAQYVDIQMVALPRTRAGYLPDGRTPDWQALLNDLKPRVGDSGTANHGTDLNARRNYTVLLDNFGVGGTWGVGTNYQGDFGAYWGSSDSADPARNIASVGGQYAFVYADEKFVPQSTDQYFEPGTMLHEITHNLGGVQYTAPNTNTGGQPNPTYAHCNDEYDVMCYADGGPTAQMRYICKTHDVFPINEPYDCGANDYFNPTPAAGSYLALKWNLYNAYFLAPCSERNQACGNGDLSVPEPENPDDVLATKNGVGSVRWISKKGRASGKPLTKVKAATKYLRDGRVSVTAKSASFKLKPGRWTLKTCRRTVKGSKGVKGKDACITRRKTLRRTGKVFLPAYKRTFGTSKTKTVLLWSQATTPKTKRSAAKKASSYNKAKTLRVKLTR